MSSPTDRPEHLPRRVSSGRLSPLFPKRKVDFLFRPLSAVSVTNFLFGKTFTKQGSERKTIFTAHITKCLIRQTYLNQGVFRIQDLTYLGYD
jgi:hypothetical protein